MKLDNVELDYTLQTFQYYILNFKQLKTRDSQKYSVCESFKNTPSEYM